MDGPTRHEFDLLERFVCALEKRIDAIRSDVNVVLGRQAPEPETNGVRPFGIGLATWAVLLTGFGGLLVGIAAMIGAGS